MNYKQFAFAFVSMILTTMHLDGAMRRPLRRCITLIQRQVVAASHLRPFSSEYNRNHNRNRQSQSFGDFSARMLAAGVGVVVCCAIAGNVEAEASGNFDLVDMSHLTDREQVFKAWDSIKILKGPFENYPAEKLAEMIGDVKKLMEIDYSGTFANQVYADLVKHILMGKAVYPEFLFILIAHKDQSKNRLLLEEAIIARAKKLMSESDHGIQETVQKLFEEEQCFYKLIDALIEKFHYPKESFFTGKKQLLNCYHKLQQIRDDMNQHLKNLERKYGLEKKPKGMSALGGDDWLVNSLQSCK